MEAAAILIKNGARVVSKDKKRMNAFHHAVNGEGIDVS